MKKENNTYTEYERKRDNLHFKANIIGSIAILGATTAMYFAIQSPPDNFTDISAFKNTELVVQQSADSTYFRGKVSKFDTKTYLIGAAANKDIDTLSMSYPHPSDELYCDDTIVEIIGNPYIKNDSTFEQLVEEQLSKTNKQMTKSCSEAEYKWKKAASEINVPKYREIKGAIVYAPRVRK